MRNLTVYTEEEATQELRAEEFLLPSGGITLCGYDLHFFTAVSDEDFMFKEQRLYIRRLKRRDKHRRKYMVRCDYRIVSVCPDRVFLEDLDDGRMSITNDAENVVAEVNSLHPGLRIIYKDTTGKWDELIHTGGVFNGYAHYAEELP